MNGRGANWKTTWFMRPGGWERLSARLDETERAERAQQVFWRMAAAGMAALVLAAMSVEVEPPAGVRLCDLAAAEAARSDVLVPVAVDGMPAGVRYYRVMK